MNDETMELTPEFLKASWLERDCAKLWFEVKVLREAANLGSHDDLIEYIRVKAAAIAVEEQAKEAWQAWVDSMPPEPDIPVRGRPNGRAERRRHRELYG
jgi:hypothetical protein